MKACRIRGLLPALLMILGLLALGGLAAAEEKEQVIDVDLAACSRGITYAQMLQVSRSPEDYDGKLFRVKGRFNYSQTNELARIIFSDNSGCCEFAMVFEPAEELVYPDDYPALYTEITITARLTVDLTDPEMPCRFTEAVPEWEEEAL